jgi:peptidyl-tRNA hydrolase
MPQTFMNRSGQAVQALAHFYRIAAGRNAGGA